MNLYFLKFICWLVGWLVGFYDISTIVGYFMPNPLYIQYCTKNFGMFDILAKISYTCVRRLKDMERLLFNTNI